MSQQQEQKPQEVSFAEYINIKRNEIVLAYDQSKERALRNFDDVSNKLAQVMQENQKLNAPKKPTPEQTPKVEKDKSRNKKQ